MTPRTIPSLPAPSHRFPERKLCSSSSCCNSYLAPGDGSGLCESCALELDLFDREARWGRIFPAGKATDLRPS